MDRFGRYQLVRRLAVGGMAEIFLARSASIDGFEKTLVIKRIRSDLSKDEKFFSMFIDEARVSITFAHPNIVQVFDFGKIDDCYYLAMELINGCDVGALVELDGIRNRGMDPGLALLITEEVCKGLDYAHNHIGKDGVPLHVVHRDISPGNIMLDFHGAVKVADFGIALSATRTTHTQPGMIVGKLCYMSPEHANNQALDRRADVFATAMVLWEMLTGRPAYGTTMDAEFFEKIQEARIAPPSSFRSDLPAELDALVMKGVARELNDRYQAARAFGEALRVFRHRHYPEASGYLLQSFLEGHRQELKEIGEDHTEEALHTGDAEELALSDAPAACSGSTQIVPEVLSVGEAFPAPATPPLEEELTAQRPAGFDWSPKLIRAIESFRTTPSLWTLVKMGKICEKEGHPEAADAFWRGAALRFAQAGLLAQALLCAKARLRNRPFAELRAEIGRLPLLHGAEDREIRELLAINGGPVNELLLELLDDAKAGGGAGVSTPLLSYLDGDAFAEFAQQARLRRFAEGEDIVKEGDSGETMYLIGQGRVLVYAIGSEGQRIYLSSLTSGDFFGENSFFTSAPRSATVEALYAVDAFEIDTGVYDRVMQRNPQAGNILLQFYKERIVETVMATSPVFGVLPVDDRRGLVSRFDLKMFEEGATIIKEGDGSNEIYLIKSGTAEVFTEQGGPRTVLSSIGPGAVFGEVAVLRGVPRTATVQATSRVEALELSGVALDEVLASRPVVKQKLMDVVAQRARENIDKLMGGSPFARNMPPR